MRLAMLSPIVRRTLPRREDPVETIVSLLTEGLGARRGGRNPVRNGGFTNIRLFALRRARTDRGGPTHRIRRSRRLFI